MDFYTYQQYLHQLIQQQQQTIQQLSTKLQSLEAELHHLQKNPTITIEKLEYNFDQLKVETLEGTLNIGISPQDLAKTDELSIPTPNNVIELTKQLHSRVEQFLETELDEIIFNMEKQTNIQLNDEQRRIIYSDIEKQLPSRINQYIQFFQNDERMDKNELFETVRNDIIQAVQTYIEQAVINSKKDDVE